MPSNGLIRIIDEDKKDVIPTLTKKEEFRDFPASFSNKETADIERDASGNVIAVVLKPMVTEDGEIATLQVVNYLAHLTETMRVLLYVLIATSIFTLIPAVFGSHFLGRVILKPIKELDFAMKENIELEKWKTIDIKNRSHDELYEMETTFNALIVHLKDSFQKQEMFVSNASHELKTPISIVKSYAQLLKRRGSKDMDIFHESVDAIDSEADRMEKLVNQMLLLAKRKAIIEKQEMDIVELTVKVIQTFKNAYERDIQFHTQVPAMKIYANVDQIEQLIYILLDNALKYSKHEVKVLIYEILCNMQSAGYRFWQGISKEDQKMIFDRFYRVDKARSRTTGGTGLGLSIASEIAVVHDGSLSVTSEENERTTFTVTLPKAD